MNQANTEIIKWSIVVIQSLHNERLTGEQLYFDVIKRKEYSNSAIKTSYYDVENIQQFEDYMHEIANNIEDGDIMTIHLEIHGDNNQRGLVLASGELVDWEYLVDLFRPINIKIGGLLLVTMAVCFGAAIISYIDPKQRAPYLCVLGASKTLYVTELADAFEAFYSLYDNALDITKAYEAMKEQYRLNGKECPLGFVSSIEQFQQVFDPDRDPYSFAMIIERKVEEYKVNGIETTLDKERNRIIELMKQDKEKLFPYFSFQDVYKA